MASFNELSLAKDLTEEVRIETQGLEDGSADILSKVSDATAELLLWWFKQDEIDLRNVNFNEGQRQAILNIIYAHEVLKCHTLLSLYEKISDTTLLEEPRAMEILSETKNQHPKYCMKMATGTGKTWVLSAILIWQMLNANRDTENRLFTRNFLLIAPGLIVYDRLLNAFKGSESDGKRNFDESDFKKYEALFIPENFRNEVFSFVQNSTCDKDEIGKKTTGNGFIGITNWHAIIEEKEEIDDESGIISDGEDLDYKEVANSIIPLAPGKTPSHGLDVLDKRFQRGGTLEFLKELQNVMVFNDEAHHIEQKGKDELEWQRSLVAIAKNKGNRFMQVDFSATPYIQKGQKTMMFAHVIVDFDIKKAIAKGYVKSLVLDKRKEVASIPNEQLDFKSTRADGSVYLSEGQRIMLRAGLKKLNKLTEDFAKLDESRCPKMLVVCEDTAITPLIEEFLVRDEGLAEDDVLRIDSDSKGKVKAEEWNKIRNRLFSMDKHPTPKVVINVLMLREGFDVNNICVIVPLRATESNILLEQIIGRGLRLMWREDEYTDIKRENRRLISDGHAPNSMIDILSVIEHPRFEDFYNDLKDNGILGEVDDDDDDKPATGDLLSVGLIDNFKQYDFAIPRIVSEQQEELQQHPIDITTIPTLPSFNFNKLKTMIGEGDTFYSEEVQTKTKFGDYRVDGGVLTAKGYNDYLARLVKRVAEILHPSLIASSKEFANQKKFPYIQINHPEIASLLDRYIRTVLLSQEFDPMQDENWRILLIPNVTEHIISAWYKALLKAENTEITAEAEVIHNYLSEIEKLNMRESLSLPANKCIYERLNFASSGGGLEKSFIEECNKDASVEAFCKINEKKHYFLRLRYIKEEGTPSFYHPDFLVRTKTHIYLTETKGEDRINEINTIRKKRAAVEWCKNINELKEEDRSHRIWEYVLLGGKTFADQIEMGQNVEGILNYAKLVEQKEDFFE